MHPVGDCACAMQDAQMEAQRNDKQKIGMDGKQDAKSRSSGRPTLGGPTINRAMRFASGDAHPPGGLQSVHAHNCSLKQL